MTQDTPDGLGIGIGIDKRAITKLLKDLCIKPERLDALHQAIRDAQENSTGNPADDIQRFIAFSTKANELAFLCFMTGLLTGSHAVISQVGNKMGEAIHKAVIVGAEHSTEIKQMLAHSQDPDGIDPDDLEITPDTPEKKKKDKQEDIMYG